MQKWDYNYLVFKLENGISIKDAIRLDQLNQAGQDGWELMSVNPLGSSFLMYTFKRPSTGAASQAAPRNAPARNQKEARKPAGNSIPDIKVKQPSQPNPYEAPAEPGINLQDILNSILGGDK